MNLHKTKIDWCSHTWNPVTGCLHGCEYCYARRITRRFGPHPCEKPGKAPLEILPRGSGCYYVEEPTKLYDEKGEYVRSTPYPVGFAPTFHKYALEYPEKREIPSTIFVSSMGDLFGKWVPDVWIQDVFAAAQRAPRHTYLFLTKNPERYAELEEAAKLPMERNFWYGATATNADQMNRAAEAFGDLPSLTKSFLSIEPLMEDVTDAHGWLSSMIQASTPYFDWFIIGGMTGSGKRHEPKREWVEKIVDFACKHHIPVFMKENLVPTWGDDLIQEFPKDMPQAEISKKPLPMCRECENATATPQGKRGTSYTCEIGWTSDRYDDRTEARHVPGRYTRTSPPWCPLRKER